ncbi:MAG: LacI family DNA-binding transcriptional regulator [Tessaracoccus sp.]|uniref:LacI family DNA-binding transcriptional regulator n=1 Tax=Tessaracoccus sp. TaxID=1971211 RepID=UPI001EC8E9DD|nr:LacI family DNA-binding transcriptional regulator [Tessaracoccus sp.]MBK7819992.1 LacI family DNA-binding transcriptional regulator [Tessaracoccus sp.]
MTDTAAGRGGIAHRGATQRQVAERAGVSAQTVSRVANDASNVEPATRDRVLAAMRELGYRRNRIGLALRSGEYRSIGVGMFTLATYGNVRTWEAIALAANEVGYSVILVPVDGSNPSGLAAALERLGEQPVDGILLLFERRTLARSEVELPAGLPVVLIDSVGDAIIDTNQAMGACQATEHLLGLGHPTVHHVAGPVDSYAAVRREEAWRSCLWERGIAAPPVRRGDWSSGSGYRAGLELLSNGGASAIFAANDEMALGVLRALHENGVDVPGETSVVGFDDMADAASFWPPLTTVRQDFAAVGRAAVQQLLDRIAGVRLSEPVPPVPTELVVRASTALYRGR